MGGVSILNLQGNTFTSPTDVSFLNIPPSNNKEGLSSPNARSILQDSYGNIWISNFRGGIDFISHTQPIFNIIGYYSNQQHKSTHAQVWGLYAEDNSIWIGGENELAYYKDNYLSTKAIPKILTHPQTHINVIAKDRKERLWLGLYKDGVVYYDLRTQRFQRVGDSASQDLDIRSIYEDENDIVNNIHKAFEKTAPLLMKRIDPKYKGLSHKKIETKTTKEKIAIIEDLLSTNN